MSLDSMGPSSGGGTLRVNRMTHSLSTPSGVDGTATHGGGGKKLAVRVQMLDDSVTLFQVQAKAMGKVLFEQVCKQLNLLEADYFGLEYQDGPGGTRYWLDLEKPLNRQVGLTLIDPMLRFCVKFYTPDPAQLEEEYTRYLFCLQIKRDLATGSMQCSDNTAALMASYIVQASCGDYAPEDYPDHTYLSSHRFVPQQDSSMQKKIMECHKKHIGQSPAEADVNLLETARRCEFYGIKMHAAKDHEGVPLNLAVAHMGIAVFQGITRINTFSWAKIRKISFKRKRFLIKLHPEGFGYYKDTVEFLFDGRNECKNFWKKCVENHGFFRCAHVQNMPRRKAKVLSRGSSFRYSGKTQKQIIEFVRDNYVKRQTFQRSQSFRQGPINASIRSQSESTPKVNTSISAHPLLPIDAVDWDRRNLKTSFLTPTQTKREVDSMDLQSSSHTDLGQSQVTVQVESYLTRKIAEESQPHLSHPDQISSPQMEARNQKPNNLTTTGADPYHTHHDDLLSDAADKLNGNTKVLSNKLNNSTTPNTTSSNILGQTYDVENKANNNDTSSSNGTFSGRRRKLPSDKAYYFANETLMTERTYKKDLEIIAQWYREELSPEDIENLNPLFSIYDSLLQQHGAFLEDLDQAVYIWSINDSSENRICNLFSKAFSSLQMYDEYVECHLEILERMNELFYSDERFQTTYREFEQQKICHLPITYLVLKPLYRLLYYEKILLSFLDHYKANHVDRKNCLDALTQLDEVVSKVRSTLLKSENFVILCEIQRDLSGFDGLVQHERVFIRQGCLLKHSKAGLQQLMFCLFSDILVYISKSQVTQTFKVIGYIPTRTLLTENGEHNTFVIFGGQKSIAVSAGTVNEKLLWLSELQKATASAKLKSQAQLLGTIKSCASSDEGLDSCGLHSPNATMSRVQTSRTNLSLHICWSRRVTVCLYDHLRASEHQISGFLLRKYKNSSGWQKLWAVVSSFCLFFYKSFKDQSAIASISLLGCSVGIPSAADCIQKDFVFKVAFKNHTYFFRTENEITFERWFNVLKNSTKINTSEKV